MKVQVIGLQDSNFKGEDGSQIVGTVLYVTYPQEKVVGLKADKFYVKESITLPAGLKAGSNVSVMFNRYGKVDEINLIESKVGQA